MMPATLSCYRWPSLEVLRIALVLVVLAVVVNASGWLVRGDHLIFDLGQRWRAANPPDDVLIIAVDQDSLDRLGRWPWHRDIHAQLLDIVCAGHPKAVGLDIAFSEPAADHSQDSRLAEAIGGCGKVLLPMLVETPRLGGQLLESPPVPVLAQASAGLGRVGVILDEDGIARSVDLWEGIGAPTWPLLAQEVLRVAGQLPAQRSKTSLADAVAEVPDRLVSSDRRRLSFIGPPGSVQRLSYAQALNGLAKPDLFAGKIVLVGVTAVGLGDFLPTPVSALGEPMPGVEVLANVLISMREGSLAEPLPEVSAMLLSALLAVVPLLWLPRLMPLAGLLASVAWVIGLIGLGALLPNLLHVWFAPSGALVAALSAFPLWSWRRLEIARRHLDQELFQLQESLTHGDSLAITQAGKRRMGFEQRIAWVQAAQQAVRAIEAQRNEALAFISHDLRTPLATAIQHLENDSNADPERLLQTLRRAHLMAQSFLSLARAEMLEPHQMHELDLTSVLHQAVDELYSLADASGRAIERRIPDDPVWIKGDFELVQRMAINLLQNAIVHSPPGRPVTLGVDRQGDTVWFWVDNEGAELPAEQVTHLFQRFGKGGGRAQSGSTGLGLYFVRTAAEKHGGKVGVAFPAGKWIRFWISLPCEASVPD